MSNSSKDTQRYTALVATSKEVQEGRGKNIIPPPEREPLWRAYLAKFKDPIIIVLLVVFVFSVGVSLYEIFVVGKDMSLLFEPCGVLLALLLATGVGFIFEVKAGKEFDILNKVKDSRPVKVLRRRDAESRAAVESIAKQDVVVGDIVRLENGDEIPADGLLIEAIQLCVDESNFTGEPYANKYVDEADFDKDATYPSNFMLRGATIIEGNALMRVTAVGMATEEGKGVARASEGSDVETPLNRQLGQLSGWISKASVVIALLIIVGRTLLLFFSDDIVVGELSFLQLAEYVLGSIMIAVTLIVVAVPEGLPMSITVSLAMSMRRMLKAKSLVRKLHACETMGATTVICSDKTGTLTQNKMTVVEYMACDEERMTLFMEGMAVNSTAELSLDDDGRVSAIGNPTEGALLMWLRAHNMEYTDVRDSHTIIAQEPFSTETKYMTTEVRDNRTDSHIRYIKGAPEIVLNMCTTIANGHTRESIEERLLSYQSRAMRTLGFAVQYIDDNGVAGDITFLGIVGIADPIRHDVREAITTCMQSAGVRVIIVTGDTPATATEIGRQIGLITSEEEGQVITGPQFAAMSDDEARRMLAQPTLKVISRARPDDKARLVMLLQQNNEVVAVTGDGTNDAPALSKAQVGLSMGDGTSRAKEASDITIIDNSFASINKAIMWGRSLYLNIRRFIIFQMTINLCACLIVLLGAFIGMESPLTVTQMLWVNLIMDTFAAMALSSLPADPNVLKDRPRDPSSHIISRAMLRRIVGTGLLFFVILVGLWQLLCHYEVTSVSALFTADAVRIFFKDIFSISPATAHLTPYEMGIFFSIFVLLQFWNMFNAKYFHTDRTLLQDIVALFTNRAVVKASYSGYFLLIAGVILVGQIVIVSCAGKLFNVAPLAAEDWGWIILITSPVVLIPEIIRIVRLLIKR